MREALVKRNLAVLFVIAFAAGYVHAGSTGPGASGGGSAVTATQSGTWTVQQGTAPWSTTISGTPAVTVSSGSLTCTGPLTDTQLRASAVPVSLAASVAVTGPLTDTQIRATPLPISGAVTTSGTATVSGTVACTGPLTDTQLRATPVPVSGTVTASGPVTDTQIRATPLPVSGPLTDTQIRATALPVSGTVTCSGPLTDTQIRATALPVSGTVTATQGTAAAASGAWTVKITDGTTVAFVTPASTAALAANPAQVVALHPTSPLPTGTNTVGSVKITDGTSTAFVTPASTAAVAANPAQVVALHPTSPLPTGSNTIGALTANQSVNVAQLGATTLVNGGLAGTMAMGGTGASNASITQNPMLAGIEALSSQPGAATTGNLRRLVGSLDGALYVRPGGPVPWTCSLDGIAATLTQCQAAPSAGLKLYVTDIVVQSTTATAGQFIVRYGTGTNCGTGTTSLFPSAATVVRIAYPGNATATAPFQFVTPLATPAANAICILCVATNTCTVQMSGYTAP